MPALPWSTNARRSTSRADGPGFKVGTSLGTVRAGQVVVATNGYTTAEPVPDLASQVVPIGSYIIVTEPLGSGRRRIFPKGSMTYTKKRLLNYMRRTPDDRILIGGRRNLHTGLDLDESAADLRRQLLGYFPDLADVEITNVWGGKLGVPFDLIPHMGQIGGVWYAMGYAGHGVGLSTLMGTEFGGMLLGEEPPSIFTTVPPPPVSITGEALVPHPGLGPVPGPGPTRSIRVGCHRDTESTKNYPECAEPVERTSLVSRYESWDVCRAPSIRHGVDVDDLGIMWRLDRARSGAGIWLPGRRETRDSRIQSGNAKAARACPRMNRRGHVLHRRCPARSSALDWLDDPDY